SEQQQAVLMLHRMREQLVKMRTMQINQLRGLLYEFGVNLPAGRQKGMAEVAPTLAQLEDTLPAMVLEALQAQRARIDTLTQDIAEIERKLVTWRKEDEAARRLMQIPGVGVLTATAAVATIGEAKVFRSGREFAAFLGLVPRQSGTGGRVKLLGISKRGDVYLRKLLIHGARSVISHGKERAPWLEGLLARRPLNAVVVALANKMARTLWALLAHGRDYEKRHHAEGLA
ncbi:MAG: IS110 family transposase, partial [Proteobacteria bacterium]|nr:IS110 family transposase [Pseudomonadota bacterium]